MGQDFLDIQYTYDIVHYLFQLTIVQFSSSLPSWQSFSVSQRHFALIHCTLSWLYTKLIPLWYTHYDKVDDRWTTKKYYYIFGAYRNFLLLVVVNHVTIVKIGHRLLKKCWPLVLGCVLRTVGKKRLSYLGTNCPK